jgi:hypothetical protein
LENSSFGCDQQIVVIAEFVYNRMVNECGAVGEIRIDWGNQSTLRNPVPMSLCPSQIPHDMIWDGTQVTMMRSQ